MSTSITSDSLLLGLPVTGGRDNAVAWDNRPQKRTNTVSLDSLSTNSHRLLTKRGTEPLMYKGESHLMTVAPTGAGKGKSVIIPNLLNYSGPVVVFDPKGENYNVTAAYRKSIGHKVIRLDPFGVIDNHGDCLNPLDAFSLKDADVETDSQMLAEMLAKDNKFSSDPYWDLASCGLYSGLIAYLMTLVPEQERHLGTIWKLITDKDLVYKIQAIVENEGEQLPALAKAEFNSFLGLSDEKTRPSVMGVAKSYMQAFQGGLVTRTLGRSSFSLKEVVDGEKLSIYLIIPPNKLQSHRALLKLWVGVLFRAITSRRCIPLERTVFLLDECAQLGSFGFLESVITLCRGYGLQVWTFWQDISQIRQLYQTGWATMINNCDILQFFGAQNYMVAREFAEIVGSDGDELRKLELTEQVLIIRGGDAVRARRFDYLKEPVFRGRFEKNPFYALH